MAISPSLVDYGRFTDAQREALTGLGLGDRGAALRATSTRTRNSLIARGMIEPRPAPHMVGFRLTEEGQATVIHHGWVPELVLRSDDHGGAEHRTKPLSAEMVEGTRIIALVRFEGAPAQTVQHVQAAWELLRGDRIEWIRVTIAGRQDDGSYSWHITVPPGRMLPEHGPGRFAAFVGDCSIIETDDSWEYR